MTAPPFDSAVLRGHRSDQPAAARFSDAAEIRPMMLVEAALAEAQGELGLIPADAAEAIARAAREAVIDPADLAAGTAAAGVVAPAFVERFRLSISNTEHAAWLHHGATSQDILDTALVLRLKRLLEQLEDRQRATLAAPTSFGAAARRWRDLPMAARTRGQIATPTSFGARVALWGAPLLRSLDRQAQLRPRLLVVSLHGAAGTSAALGEQAPQLRAKVAERLGLADAPLPWHAARDALAELASHLSILTAAHGKIGRDLLELARSESGEVRAGAAGGSSTMPHKRNPVGPEALVALARHASRLSGALQEAMLAEHERDGAAWTLEWLSLPQLCVAAAASARHAQALSATLAPDERAMAETLAAQRGLPMAEAASFRLVERGEPRPEAQARLKSAAARVHAEGRDLADILAEEAPGEDWAAFLDPALHMGEAPDLAEWFASRAEAAAGL